MDTWEFFQDSKGLWRWRCTSADGNVVLNSAEAYPLRVQAMAEALEHGFVEGESQVDSQLSREIDPDVAAELETLKLNYLSAHLAYENRVAALADAPLLDHSTGLRKDVANALHALERARKEYRDMLLTTAFGVANAEG